MMSLSCFVFPAACWELKCNNYDVLINYFLGFYWKAWTKLKIKGSRKLVSIEHCKREILEEILLQYPQDFSRWDFQSQQESWQNLIWVHSGFLASGEIPGSQNLSWIRSQNLTICLWHWK